MKKRASQLGFLLPSFVMYAAIVTLLVSAAARLTVLVIPIAYNLVQWCTYTNFYTAHDFIARQIACAPIDSASWIKADIDGFIWRGGDATQAVLVKKGALIYKEGTYNNGRWGKASTSLLAQGCQFTAVQLMVEGDRATTFYCRAMLTGKPEHSWELRQGLHD